MNVCHFCGKISAFEQYCAVCGYDIVNDSLHINTDLTFLQFHSYQLPFHRGLPVMLRSLVNEMTKNLTEANAYTSSDPTSMCGNELVKVGLKDQLLLLQFLLNAQTQQKFRKQRMKEST